MTKHQKEHGFTLVELSIVIVIIGLIVAGVVAGQTLVKQAQLRAVISEGDKVKTAINAFRLQYNAIPGDFNNAAAYWASASQPCGATAAAQTTPNTGNCNGDGDKRVELGGTAAVNSPDQEVYRAWEHLQYAGMFPGNYTGRAGAAGTAGETGDINVNIPASKFSTGGLTIVYDDTNTDATAGDGDSTDGNGRQLNKNVLIVGGEVSDAIANGTIFSSAQALSVDEKADDGVGTTGVIVGTGTTTDGAATCLDGTQGNDYNLDATDTTPCALAFSL